MLKQLILILVVLSLTACVQTGRYQIKTDKAPLRKPTTLEMQQPTPKYEKIYPWSLKPYVVHGKRYVPLKTAKGYQSQGIASWYGRKFHGHTTANGEIYDMFAMTAAHKTLPIPSYVRVTNLSNNKSIIVRVNDRGPFHPKRVIDLSYAAAYALDITAHGTAEVHLETIVVDKKQHNQQQQTEQKNNADVDITTHYNAKDIILESGDSADSNQTKDKVAAIDPTFNSKVELKAEQSVDKDADGNADTNNKPNAQTTRQLFVQVLASSDKQRISKLAKQLSDKYKQNHHIPEDNQVFRLRLGPLQSEPQAQALIEALQNNGYSGAYMLYTEVSLPHN